MANDVDPQIRKKVEKLLKKMLRSCKEEVVFDFLKPCTRVSITITMSRGLSGLHIETAHRIGGLSSGLISDDPITDDVWEQIFALKPFSEKPDRTKDLELRKTLLHIREFGYLRYHSGYHFHKPINEILSNNEIPYRYVKMYIQGEACEGYVIKKIE